MKTIQELKVLIVLVALMPLATIQAQVKIGQDAEPVKGAVLELHSNKATGYVGGLRLANVSLTNITDLTQFSETPADVADLKGAIVYNTNPAITGGNGIGVYYWDGSKWVKDAGTTTDLNAWLTTGNDGTNSIDNFIGTTDDNALMFRVNDTHAGMISNDPYGSVSFGINALPSKTGWNNVAIGGNILKENTSGSYNVAIGNESLGANTSGYYNIGLGGALRGNTTGWNNIGIGSTALYYNTRGGDNIAIGGNPLYKNETGNYNIAMGSGALWSNVSGGNNIAMGNSALHLNIDGGNNVAVGNYALHSNTSGTYNTAIGYFALNGNTTNSYNVAVGYFALDYSKGKENTAVGSMALAYNASGDYNTALGYNALRNNDAGSNNVAIGHSAAAFSTLGNLNVVVGYSAMPYGKGDQNVIIGYRSAPILNEGSRNIIIGNEAAQSLYKGDNNIVIGNKADVSDDTNNQISIGNLIYGTGVTGIRNDGIFEGNIGIGTNTPNAKLEVQALAPYTGFRLVDRGVCQAGYVLTANALGYATWLPPTAPSPWYKVGSIPGAPSTQNTDDSYLMAKVVIGSTVPAKFEPFGATEAQLTVAGGDAIINGITVGTGKGGIHNTAVGTRALRMNTADSNTAVGYIALEDLQTGYGNTAMGSAALSNLRFGNYNTAVGIDALSTMDGDQSYNTALGFMAGSNSFGSHNITIGANTNTEGDYKINIGNLIFATDADGSMSGFSPNDVHHGNLGVGTHDPQTKFHIQTGGKADAPVKGFMLQDGNEKNKGWVLTTDDTGLATWQALPTTGAGASPWHQFPLNMETEGSANVTAANAMAGTGTPSTLNSNNSYLRAKVIVGIKAEEAILKEYAYTQTGQAGYQFYVTGGNASINGVDVGSGSGDYGNTAVGLNALNVITNSNNNSGNVAVGAISGQNIKKGANNVAIGVQAMGGLSGADNPNSADMNTAVGSYALRIIKGTKVNDTPVDGQLNTVLGYGAGCYITTGSKNIMIGVNPNPKSSDTDMTGNNNIIIGNDLGSRGSSSNQVVIGNSSNNAYYMYNTTSWTNASDRRLKHDIKPIGQGVDFVLKLKPVEFLYNNGTGKKSLGFIAQDVQDAMAAENMEGYGLVSQLEGDILGLNTSDLIPVLTKAIQEQQQMIEALQKINEQLEARLKALETK
ncbi:MAG: tail fiber domain-containing protein [Dysgonamonadaceae bacterium]|nr:tail fiber domain-containing protein [Dysgonamonadaceae bacterium]